MEAEEEEAEEEKADASGGSIAGCPAVKGPLDCRTMGSSFTMGSILGAASGAETARPLNLDLSSSGSAFHIWPR